MQPNFSLISGMQGRQSEERRFTAWMRWSGARGLGKNKQEETGDEGEEEEVEGNTPDEMRIEVRHYF
jgi:hypothetical protein